MSAMNTAAPVAAARPRGGSPNEPRDWQAEFERSVLVHRDWLHRRALKLCRNPADAEDLVQETYLRAFRRFDSFTPGTNCGAWLATILRNTFLNLVTRQTREAPGRDATTVERELALRGELAPDPEQERVRHVIDDRRLADAVEALPGKLRWAVILADVEECSYREIAEICGVPVGTVMSRLFRGRRRLRRALRNGRADAPPGALAASRPPVGGASRPRRRPRYRQPQPASR